VGEVCESASARRVAKQFGLTQSTVRAIDLRYLERWNAQRKKPALRHLRVDEIFLGKSTKFVTVTSNLESGEPLWFGRERKKETLDEFFRTELGARQRQRIEPACVDMWEPFKASIQQWSPGCAIVYDKLHIMQHANHAVDGVRRAEFFRKGARMRGVAKGKRWLLLSRWIHLNPDKRQQLNHLFSLNRKMMKAYFLKESLERLWTYTNEGAMLRYLKSWTLQLRWQRLPAFERRAHMLIDHVNGISQLLPRQGPLRRGGGHERQHQKPSEKGAGLQESALPAPQGSAHGGHQDRIRRSQESRLKWPSRQIPAQNQFLMPF